jgi:SNF2 family DNA or RNA helicase
MFIYEEFMARSSTRQALKKGGNFMGMMNVLMQLRKVVNHPDLFEPRSVVTPFVVEPIVVPMASCIVGMTSTNSAFAKVSDSLLSPLWSGSQGAPTMDAGLRHDVIESKELLDLEAELAKPSKHSVKDEGNGDLLLCSTLRALADEVYNYEYSEKCENIKFLNKLNSRRCRAAPFPYPRRLIEAMSLSEPPLQRTTSDVLSTPAQLLVTRRDQQERAEDVSGLIKRFVFAVPKAGAQPVAMDTDRRQTANGSEAILNEVLLEPVQGCLRPFREAHARLTSFFPDKKLVQFDAGKLQALAELLRERKRGGHKVLIFTQMSKMLDILEAFLNMNGHTYVRLDGGTSIEQRQRLMDRFNNDPKIFCFILSTRSGGTGVNLTGADTVVFYDSDWNPAQDAQAQDRAHR